MSMAERNRHHRKGESRAQSQARKYSMKKLAAVVNHIDYERHHGFESTKHTEKSAP